MTIEARTARAAEEPIAIFSEVAWAGSAISTADEWIELHNPGDQEVDLEGWQIVGGPPDQPTFTVTLPSMNLAAGAVMLVANNEANHQFNLGQSALSATPDYVNAAISLSNTALRLELRSLDGEVIDRVGNGGVPFAGSALPHASMERIIDPLGDGSEPGSWKASVARVGFDDGVVDLGTPREIPLSSVIHEEAPQVSQTTVEYGNLRLSEVLPAPIAGSGEFIELENLGSYPFDIGGWRLDDSPDGGSKPYTFPSRTIAAHERIVVWSHESKLALNNDGDSVLLYDSSGTLRDRLEYGRSKSGLSWALMAYEQLWKWTTPSPTTENPIPPDAVLEDPKNNEKGVQEKAIIEQSLASLVGGWSSGNFTNKKVRTRGIVSVPAQLYDGRRVIVSEGEFSLELQPSTDLSLALRQGDIVDIVGSVSRAKTPRILIAAQDDVRTLERHDYSPLDLGLLNEIRLHQFIRGHGRVIAVGAVPTVLDEEGREFRLSRKRGVVFPGLSLNVEIAFTGLIVNLDPVQVRVLEESQVAVLSTEEHGQDQDADGVDQEDPEAAAESDVLLALREESSHDRMKDVFGIVSAQPPTSTASPQVLGAQNHQQTSRQSLPWLAILTLLGIGGIVGDLLWIHLATELPRSMSSPKLRVRSRWRSVRA